MWALACESILVLTAANYQRVFMILSSFWFTGAVAIDGLEY